MIRKATYDDAPAIMALIRAQHARSKYATRCRINDASLEHLVTAMIAQQGQIGPQGSCLFVADDNGKVVAFIAGVLDRVYQIGAKLTAHDLFFVNEDGGVGDTLHLLDHYIGWARSIRAVLEIKLSWSDTLPGAEQVAKLYQRKGFSKCGEVYEVRTDAQALGEAA
jgi:hypothetical protein